MVINIEISNKRAAVIGAPIIVCGNSDYTVAFQFDSEWDEHLNKTARFSYVKEGKPVYVDVVFNGNSCAVPVISNTTVCDIGVYAGDLCTTTPARVACVKSILCAGGNPPDPSPEVYAQIMKILDENYPLEAGMAANAAAENANQAEQRLREGGYIESLKESNHGKKFKVWVGTKEEYAALTDEQKKAESCLYLLTDDDFSEIVFSRLDALEAEWAKSGRVLWEGAFYMQGSQTVDLSGDKAIDQQPSGIILCFAGFSGGKVQAYENHSFFIHKSQVAKLPGCGYSFPLFGTGFDRMAVKQLSIYKNKITGVDVNGSKATNANGITYDNTAWVLNLVIGV